MRRKTSILKWLVLLVALADLSALKAGWLSHPPEVLAALFGLVLIAFVFGLAREVRALVVGDRRGRSLGSALVSAGIIAALLGGTVNWLLGLQGFAILTENEPVSLHRGTQLQEFDAGPLASIDEMRMHLALDELELVPSGPDAFFPRSHLRVWQTDEQPTSIEVTPREDAAVGPLRFLQGAFGFAPRIVIVSAGDRRGSVFDRVVPFTTERHGPSGIAFDGSFTVSSEDLHVEGTIDLASLDEGMRGHAMLELAVTRDGEALGQGRLLPGHFAEIDQGYRLGFTGLEKWSEIVISRRNYGGVVLAGAIVVLVGVILWSLAVWRGW